MVILGLCGQPSVANELQFQWQGFVTFNYKVSDEETAYQRFVDKAGTFKSGSVVGVQTDATWGPKWSATVRAALAPDNESDQGFEPAIRWASVSYAATEHFKLSVGRLRAGLYRDAANLEVGSTYVPLTLAPELYFSENLIRYDGFRVQYRNLDEGGNERVLEAFDGKTDTAFRSFNSALGTAQFRKAMVELSGIRYSLASEANTQVYFSAIRATFPEFNNYRVQAYTAGLAMELPEKVSMELDFAYYSPRGEASSGQSSHRVSMLGYRPYGNWVPYLGLSYGEQRRVAAENQQQWSGRLGTAYNLDLKTRLKAEVEHVQVGAEDLINDGILAQQSFTVLGLSYNKLF